MFLLPACFAVTFVIVSTNYDRETFNRRRPPIKVDPSFLLMVTETLDVGTTSYCNARAMTKDDSQFIVDFQPIMNSENIFSMSIYGCSKPLQLDSYKCDLSNFCSSSKELIYTWMPHVPNVRLPPNVGYELQHDVMSHLVLYVVLDSKYKNKIEVDVGFKVTTTFQQIEFRAGTYTFSGSSITPIVDIGCLYNHDYTIFPFAFQVNADDNTIVVSYRVRDSTEWDLIGKAMGEWGSAFYPMDSILDIEPSDILVMRCFPEKTNRRNVLRMQSASSCTFSIMYFTMSNKYPYLGCRSVVKTDLMADIPERYTDISDKLSFNILEDADYSSKILQLERIIDHQKNELRNAGKLSPVHEVQQHEKEVKELVIHETRHSPLKIDESWPHESVRALLGQAPGVATYTNGSVCVFHRANRLETPNSFRNNSYDEQRMEIDRDTVLTIDAVTGGIISSWGRNYFILPHGIYIDSKNNVWLTDVALHQVFKFDSNDKTRPILTLGERLIPGNDSKHFCRPTDVAIDEKSGNIFVADGYCNSRIVKLTSAGKFITSFSLKDSENTGTGLHTLVHSVTIIVDMKLVCACDREYGQITCFDIKNGRQKKLIHSKDIGSRINAVSYSNIDKIIYVLNGDQGIDTKVQGFTVNVASGKILQKWGPPEGFSNPHDLSATPFNDLVFVVEFGKKGHGRVLKFHQEEISLLKGGQRTNSINSSLDFSEKQNFYSSIIIMLLLAIPIVIVVTVTIMSRLNARGKIDLRRYKVWVRDRGYSRRNGYKKSYRNGFTGMLSSKKGFSRLPNIDSDREEDPLTDSEIEEYSSQKI